MANDNENGIDTELLKTQMATLFKTIGDDLKRFNDRARDYASSSGGIGKLDLLFSGMSRTLLGGAGLAYGFSEIGKALQGVAIHSATMQAFARDTGFSTVNVMAMQQAMKRLGMSTSETQSAISALGGKLSDLGTFKETSSLYQTLIGVEGGASFANRLKDLVRAGDQLGAVNELLRTFALSTNEGKNALASYFNMSVSALEGLSDAMKRNVHEIETNKQAAREWLNTWTDISTHYSNNWTKITNAAIEGTNTINQSLANIGVNKTVADLSNDFFDEGVKRFKTDIGDLKTLIEAAGKVKDAFAKVPQNFRAATGIGLRNYPLADDPMGADYQRRGQGVRGITDFGGMRRTQSIEEDSNRTLVDIRDTLQRMEGKVGTTFGKDYGTGTRSEGAMNASGGGFRPSRDGAGDDRPGGGSGQGGTGGTRGNRNNNRGNLKYGDFAKSMGATGADDKGFAIFPDTATGDRAHEALLKSDRYKGLTLDQFGNKYSEGSESWKATVGKQLGIGRGDVVDNNHPDLAAAIRKAEGTEGGTGTGGGRVNYFQRQGKGPFTAAEMERVKTPFGPINVHPDAAGDFKGFYNELGEAGAPINKLGSYNYRKMRWGNQWSSHAMGAATDIDDQVQLSPKMREWIDANPDRWEDVKKRYNMRQPLPQKDPAHVEWTGPSPNVEAARKRMEEKNGNAGAFGQLNGKIEFLNVPPNVRTTMEQEGDVFHQLRVTKSRQNEVAGGEMGQPFAGVW